MSGEKIIVCDDDNLILQFCATVLKRAGYEVTCANCGYEALRLTKDQEFDLLLIDYVLPDINGLETFEAIRTVRPDVVGTLMTGYGTLSTAINAINLGFKGFVTKPFTHEELLFAITRALDQNKLEKQVLAYKQASELKDRFITLISHELRTPLALILSSSNLLKNIRPQAADKDERRLLAIIGNESRRLNNIINDLILMTELNGSTEQGGHDPLDFRQITEEAVKSLQEVADERGITVSNMVPEGISTFYGQRPKIIKLMVNLLDNAIKFNRDGGEVTITAKKSNDLLQCELENTGLEIPDNITINDLFNPFNIAEDPLTKEKSGLGLGLSVCKRILDLHGGKIWAQRIPGKGSKFVFTLPQKSPDEPSDSESEKAPQ